MEYLTCPFCNETDFDVIGLKMHLALYCEEYDKVPLGDSKEEHSLEPVKESYEILNLRQNQITYTKGQREALIDIENFILGNTNKYTLSGLAGTGKTYVIENMVNRGAQAGKKVTVVAPTNRAKKIVKSKIPPSCRITDIRTIHSFLYGAPDEETGEWIPSVKMTKDDLVICDESSMIDKSIYDDIMNNLNGAKVIFVGDPFQLEPVGNNPNLFKDTNYTLTQVKRQASDSNILKYALYLRYIKCVVYPATSAPDIKLMYPAPVLSRYIESVKNGEDSIYITGTNRHRLTINREVRKAVYGNEEDRPIVGDRLISIANSVSYANSETFDFNENYEFIEEDIFKYADGFKEDTTEYEVKGYLFRNNNGSKTYLLLVPEFEKPSLYHQAIADIIQGDYLKSLFKKENGKSFKSLSKAVTIATYGYCISVFKSQGGQFEKVFVKIDWPRDNPKNLYTAITRAEKELYLSMSDFPKVNWDDINSVFAKEFSG